MTTFLTNRFAPLAMVIAVLLSPCRALAAQTPTRIGVPDTNLVVRPLRTIGAFRAALGPGGWPQGPAVLAQLQRSDPGYTLPRDSLYTIGSYFLRNDQFAEGLGVYRVYTKLNPGQARGWNGLGDAYAGTHDTVSAAASYREALKVAPENARALAGLKKMGQGPPVQGPTALATSSSPALAQDLNATAPPVATRTRVIMLGTGNPVADPDRFGPATVILVDSTAYLVDCGVGVVRRWAGAIRAESLPLRPWDLRRVFITHLHSDHTLGYPDLILSSWTLERNQREPLRVFGPSGTRAMTDHLLAAYAEDIRIRTGLGGELAGARPPQVDVHEIDPGVVYRDSLVTVTAFAVHHGTWPQAFGFRFQTPDKVIVLSGDAAPPSAILSQCNGCDILIHEGGTFHRGTGGEYQRQFHTSMEDLLEIVRVARPKLLVMYHQNSSNNEEGLRFLKAGYDGRVVIAKDLDAFR